MRIRQTAKFWLFFLLLLVSLIHFSRLQPVGSQEAVPVGTATPFNYNYVSIECPDPLQPISTDITVKIEGSASRFMSPTSWTWTGVECGGEARSQQVVFAPPCGVSDGTYSWVAYASSSNPEMPLSSSEQKSGSFTVFTPPLSVQIGTGQQYALGETVTFAVLVKTLDGSGIAASVAVALDGVVVTTVNSGSDGTGVGIIGKFSADQAGQHYLTATASAGVCYRSSTSKAAVFSVIVPEAVVVTETFTITEVTTETSTETFTTVTEISMTQTETTTSMVVEITTETVTVKNIDIVSTTTTETASDDP